MRTRSLLSLIVFTACAPAGAPPAPEAGAARPAVVTGRPVIPASWTLAGKAEPVRGRKAMIVSGHPIASAVGIDILKKGGNAIDAAVAVGFALAVVQPIAGNIGGGGFLVYRDTAGKVSALDFRETAPGRATRDMYLDSTGNPTDRSTVGHLAAAVPGSVAGLAEAHKRLGRLPWADLLAPAVRLARDGHRIDQKRAENIADVAPVLARFPASREKFLPRGRPLAVGALWKQPDLARTLQLIADSGTDAFYRGQIADSIVAEMERRGGIITKDDLRGYRVKWRTPVQLTYRGYTIYTMPPPSSGGVTLGLILNVMEGFDTLAGFGRAASLHFEAEAMRRAFMERNRWLGDPDFVDLPLERLLSKSYAAELRGAIDPRRATPTPPDFVNSKEGAHTTHYSIVDTAGNAVAVTTTLNDDFGGKVTVTGAGFLLNDEMDDFASAPGKPNLYGLVEGEANAIAPGKRMLSAMTPAIVLDPEGRLFLVLGSPGGPRIITSVYHVLVNIIDHRMSLAEAVVAPRLHHQALPDSVSLEEGGFAAATVASLRSRGHAVREWTYKGEVNAIQRGRRGWIGVADPRRGGGVVGW